MNKEIEQNGLVISSNIANVVINELLRNKLDVSYISKDNRLYITSKRNKDEVIYTVKGEIGNSINNPDIKFSIANDVKLPADKIISKNVRDNYTTIKLLLIYKKYE